MNGSLFRQAAASFAIAAPAIAQAGQPAPQPLPAPASEAIVFSRARLLPDGALRGSQLLMLAGDGSDPVELTPAVDGVHDTSATWSPDGLRIAFERGQEGAHGRRHYRIHTVDRTGRRVRPLVHGPGSFRMPAWGPDGRVAFIAVGARRQCVATVDSSGHRRRELFCAPAPAEFQRPMWSADGRSLFVSAGYYAGDGLEPLWHSLAWRVDATTGVATLLGEEVMEQPRDLQFSPDGRSGIYSDTYPSEMLLVDFATGERQVLGVGHAPRWSPDGRRIAFTGEVYEAPPDFRYYSPLFVVEAGGEPRRITASRLPHHAYIAASWSKDGTRVLANRVTWRDPALTLPVHALRIIDVETRQVAQLAEGQAETGAWFQW